MIVALYQNNPEFGRVKENIETVLRAVSDKDFDLLVLPELFATGYQFKDREEAQALSEKAGDGITFDAMKNLAAEKDALIIYGFPELDGDRLFNSAAAVFPDGSFEVYQKVHLFDSEKRFFSPGESGFFVFQYKEARVGIMICFDWRFPESARKLALDGARIICHPANLVLPFCPDAMIVRALENLVFTITADRVGDENRTGENLHFHGRSRIISPDGKILGELGEYETGYLSAEIDPGLADDKQIGPLNNLFDDRRPELY